nr:hypothetical protein [Oceanispirochaeta crateris]
MFFSMLAYAEEIPEEENTEKISIKYHAMGDQVFSISAGLFIPLYFNNPNLAWSDSDAFTSTNLSLGGNGALYYGAFLNNNIQLGLEIGAMFAGSPNDHNFYMVPITFRGSYEFQFKNNLIAVPVYIGAGINMTSYLESFNVEMILKPGAGFYWNYSSDWSFGTNVTYWWVPQIYPGDSQYNRLGNFMDISLSAVYHF